MLLDFLNQFASALFLVIAKAGVVELNEESRLGAGFIWHLLHVGLHLLDGRTIVGNGIFRVSSFSWAQESALTSISLHIH
jgi:hypothetical protein